MREVLRRFDREAAMHVHGTLRPPRRTRRVNEHVRIFGRGIGETAEAYLPAQARYDDHCADAERGVHRGVGCLLHLYHLPAPQESVGRNEHAGLAVAQPAGNRVAGIS